RHHGEDVAHDAKVRHVKDGRVAVLVDGHDGLGGLHAGPVLDGPGNAEGDVQLWGDADARLPHLCVLVHVAGVDGGTGGADCGAERVGQLIHENEVFLRPQAATAGDHGLCGAQFRAGAGGGGVVDG